METVTRLWMVAVLVALSSSCFAATNTLHDKDEKTTPTVNDETYIFDVTDSILKKSKAGNLPISTATQSALDMKASKPHINASAPADITLDWYDTDQEQGVYVHKKHNGTTWVRVGSYGVQYASSCASITAGMCVDTVDGKLYYHNGTAVVEVGSCGSVDLSAYLSKTNTTAFTPSGDYHPATKKYVDDSITAGGGYTDEQAQDAVGGMFSSNTETGITVTYNDSTGKVDFVVATQSDVNFTSALNTKLSGIAAGAEVNVNADWDAPSGDAQILHKPSTTPLTVLMVTDLFSGTGDCLGANGEKVACGSGTSGYTNLTELVSQTAWRLFYSDGSGDVKELALGSSGQVLKSNGASAAPSFQADDTAAGAGYVSTPPTYSDAACTAGQYALSESYRFDCIGSGNWNRTPLTDWSNPQPVTRTLTVTSPSHGTITCTDADLSASINCGTGGSTCSATAADAASITGITATADSGYELSAWSGDLSGTTNPTTLTMSANRSIGATFAASVSNGEVGNKNGTNDDQATPPNYPGADQAISSCFSAVMSGPVGYIHMRLSSSPSTGHQYNAGIYSSDGTLIADGSLRDEPGTVPGIMTFPLDSTVTIISGETYCLAVGDKSPADGWYVSTTIGGNVYVDTTFDVENTLPSSVDVSTVRQSGYSVRIWATNTPDGT